MDELLELMRHIADGAYVIDNQQRIIFWNDSAEALLGFAQDEVIGELCYRVLAGRDEDNCPLCRRDCIPLVASTHGKPVPNFDTLVRTKDNRQRWINVSIITVPAAEGGVRGVIHLFRDIDAKKQAEAFAAEIALRAGQLKLQPAATLRQPFPEEDARADGQGPESALAGTGPTLDELTPRERQVLWLLVAGADTDSIAAELMISKSTVRNHIQHILHKLGVHSRLEAVAYAREHGLI